MILAGAVPGATDPVTWGYVLGALAGGLVFAAPFLLIAYLSSDGHRRRMARVRSLHHRPRRTR